MAGFPFFLNRKHPLDTPAATRHGQWQSPSFGVAVGMSGTDTTGSIGQLQIIRGGGTRPVVLAFSVPGLTAGLTTVGTVACVLGAFTQAQAHSESMTSAAKIRKSGIVLRFIGIILVWHKKDDNYCLDFENIRSFVTITPFIVNARFIRNYNYRSPIQKM